MSYVQSMYGAKLIACGMALIADLQFSRVGSIPTRSRQILIVISHFSAFKKHVQSMYMPIFTPSPKFSNYKENLCLN